MVDLELGRTADTARVNQLRRFEADLVLLLKNKAIARQLKAIDLNLPALAQDGSLQPRTALVRSSYNNDLYMLPSRFLLEETERRATLDRLSPPLRAPTANMLLTAFSQDSGSLAALQPRLKHFLSVTEPESPSRLRLAEMPIIPADGRLLAPATLAFRRPGVADYWGAWKTSLSSRQLSQDDQSRYRAAGVTSAEPNAKTSLAFFTWLSGQGKQVLHDHVPPVLHHILHRHGPTEWPRDDTDTPFIPVRRQNGLGLVSLRTARSKPVYLPDGVPVADELLRWDRDVLLVLDRVEAVQRPISEPLRALGIRSLRDVLGEPRSVLGGGDVGPVDDQTVERLRYLQSSPFQRTFEKRLGDLGVDAQLLRRNWPSRIKQVHGVRHATTVKARHYFRRRVYELDVAAGFDVSTGLFYIKRGQGNEFNTLYETLAKQLIFKPSAPRIYHYALERAVGLKFDEFSFGRPTQLLREEETSRAESGENDDNVSVDEPGEAAPGGHSPIEPDPARNEPSPAPLPTESVQPFPGPRPKAPPGDLREDDDQSERQRSQAEREHVRALKGDHYAMHCQMCLCKRSPNELAPAGSYVEPAEVRRFVVDAHHVDLVSAGGAGHAGNLILLCKLHHNNIGRKLSRALVTWALRNDAKRSSVTFGEGATIHGQRIKIAVPATREVIELFFTDDHANYWLLQDKERTDGGAPGAPS